MSDSNTSDSETAASPMCATCDVAMEAGWVLERSFMGPTQTARWVDGEIAHKWNDAVETDMRKKFELRGFRCPSCGRVELFATKRVYE